MDFVIHDTVPMDLLEPPDGRGKGLDLSLKGPDGYAGLADPFPASLLLSDTEIMDRIRERKERKLRHRDIAELAGLPCKDQERTNYCWINAPTYCLEYVRVMAGKFKVILSPASAGAPIKNFSNVGGWGKEGLQWVADRGLVPADKWPANAIDRRYYTPENRQLALDYRASEWWELEPRNLRQMASVVVGLGLPVAVGYNWWSHEVTCADFDILDGAYWPVIRNSWGMGWQDMGYAILQGTRALPDDAVCPRVALAS